MVTLQDKMTFDALTSIYRVERGSSTLSVVRKDLYPAMIELLNSQVKECDRIAATNPDSIMYDGATERKKKTLQLIKKIVEQRMNKISSMALRGAMGANNVIESLTPEEKDYYNAVLESSKKHWSLTERKKKLASVDITSEQSIEKREPVKEVVVETVPEPATEIKIEVPKDVIEEPTINPDITEQKNETADEFNENPTEDEEFLDLNEEFPPEVEEEPIPEPVVDKAKAEPIMELPKEETVIIRILDDIPPFSGPDRDYNLKKEDIVRMPSTMAMALINRGKAVLINI